MQMYRTAPDPLDWRFILALCLLAVGLTGLALLGLIWCYSDSYFGGHLGFALQVSLGLCCVGAGWFARGSGDE